MAEISKPRSVAISCGWSYGPGGRVVQLRPGIPISPREGNSSLLDAELNRRPLFVRRRRCSRPELIEETFSPQAISLGSMTR